jgi:hypothetical protein
MITDVVSRPESLAGCMATWSEKTAEMTVRSVMDNPSVCKVRRRFTAPINIISCQVNLESKHFDALMQWYGVDCQGGVNPTYFKRPQDGAEVVARFAEPPVIDWIQADVFSASFKLEQLPEWVS